MPQLTQTEAWFLDECLKGEALLVKKIAANIQQVRDPQLRQVCQDALQTHQRHFQMLSSQIQ